LSYIDILYEDNPHPTKTKHPKIMEAAENCWHDKIKEVDEDKDAKGVRIRWTSCTQDIDCIFKYYEISFLSAHVQ
jgi:hypothetical protein